MSLTVPPAQGGTSAADRRPILWTPPAASRALVMGVLNRTPDSFSDGGAHLDGPDLIDAAAEMVAAGADVLDVGGESTRPGADPVDEDEELQRVLPAIEALATRFQIPISIDTRRPRVAQAAVKAGAVIWNDVSALTGGDGAEALAANLGCAVVLMHMQGDPQTMQAAPRYGNVVAEVSAFLTDRAGAAMAAGVPRGAIWIDPGIGFGKTLNHNLTLLAHLDRLAGLGFPVLLGASRKGMIRAIDPSAVAALDRLGGSLAIALAGQAQGCRMIRVHDVRETVQALSVAACIDRERRAHE